MHVNVLRLKLETNLMEKTIKATNQSTNEGCCGKQVKKSERKKIVFKKTINKK